MNWANVPAYQRPLEKREDAGLAMPHRWSRWLRFVWELHVEMALPLRYQRMISPKGRGNRHE